MNPARTSNPLCATEPARPETGAPRSAIAPDILPSLDRIRVIRRSLRCLIFGLIGVVPVLGIGLALLALHLHDQVVLETGEGPGLPVPNRRDRLSQWLYWFIGAAYVHVYGGFYGLAGAVMTAGLFIVVPWVFLWQRYRRCAPKEWNPARRHLYWGAGLGWTGSFGTVTVLLELALAPWGR